MASEKLFKEKLKVLNEEFVDFVSSAFQENPCYDFTPSVTDYINHVKRLDDDYAEKPTERKIVIAKRRVTKSAVKTVEKPKETSKPDVPEPKKLSNGLVEPVGQFAFAPKVQMPAIPSATTITPVFSAPKATDQPTPLSQSRKRRQEPLDYDDMRNKSSDDYGKASSSTPQTNNSLFGGSFKPNGSSALKGPENSTQESSTPPTNNSLFGGLVKPGGSLALKGPENSTQESSTPSTINSLFGGSFKPNGSSSLKGPENSTQESSTPPTNNSLFGGLVKPGGSLALKGPENSTQESSTPSTINSLFGGSFKPNGSSSLKGPENSTQESSTPPTNNSLFGGLGKPSGIFAFKGLENSNQESSTPPTNNSLFGGLGKPSGIFAFKGLENSTHESSTPPTNNSLFGGLGKPGGSFVFKGPENSTQESTNGAADNNKEGEDGEAEDAPPPKVEAIKHEEPDAVFSTKCSLFNFVNNEYKKVGIGFLHIKKTDAGTQLLIRAATALGTVWINTLINNSFKAEKKDKDKIQFSYPSAEGAKTSLVRVVDVDDAVAYLTGVKKP